MRKQRSDTLRLAAVLAFSGTVLAVAPEARAACDCVTAGQAPYCTGSSVTYVADGLGQENRSMTVNLGPNGTSGSTYTCGQYANGDVWVVGKGSPAGVEVASVSPSWNGSTHGWDANPGPDVNHMESRSSVIPFSGAPRSLPATYTTGGGPVSFLKNVGKAGTGNTDPRFPCGEGDHRPCTGFIAVVTFVGSVPDSNGNNRTDDEFRPGVGGSNKPGPFRVDAAFETRAAAFPKLSKGPVPSADSLWTMQKAHDRYRWPQLAYLSRGGQNHLYAESNTKPWLGGAGNSNYGHSRAQDVSASILRMLLDDFDFATDALDRQTLINVVQAGIDLYSQGLAGTRWDMHFQGGGGWGGGYQGDKLLVVFAAHMLNDAAFKNWVAGGSVGSPRQRINFLEEEEVYRGADGVAYYGIDGAPHGYCSACSGSGQCRQPDRIGDSMCCSGGTAGKSYSERSSNHMPYEVLAVRLLGMEGIYNHDAYLEYGGTWFDGGRTAGHTQYRWCGNQQASQQNQRSVSTYSNQFGNEMWAVHSTAQGTPGPTRFPAPDQIIP